MYFCFTDNSIFLLHGNYVYLNIELKNLGANTIFDSKLEILNDSLHKKSVGVYTL